MYRLTKGNSYNETIPVIEEKVCPRGSLLICNIPQFAHCNISDQTSIEIIEEGIFVRGVNSSFHLVETKDGSKYYVHEQYVVKNYDPPKTKHALKIKCPDCSADLLVESDHYIPDDLTIKFVKHNT